MRILMIEDTSIVAQSTEKALKLLDQSIIVDIAGTLADAVSMIEEGDLYDVALVDLRLPDASGSEAPQLVQRLCPETVVVVVTGSESSDLALDLVRQGIHDFVPKSEVTPQRLLRTIRLACERQRREKKLREVALHDPLTGALNRRGIERKLSESMSLTRRLCMNAALFTIDIDHFKQVNDRYGHQAGDAVLRQCAGTVLQKTRLNDHVGRIGGDEFLLLLNGIPPNADLSAAADKVLSFFSAPCHYSGQIIPTSASIGLAVMPVHATTIDAWLKASDEALYEAKNAGRGCWRAYSQPPDQPIAQFRQQ
jgi:diguanylate cyclase (GGDEF)-like protein